MRRAVSSELGSRPTSRDERLRRARRLDWRFLAPDPRIGRVGVLGAIDDDLRDALESLGPVGSVAAGGPTFDTVILGAGLDRSSVAAAAASIGPGGRIVIEIGGPLAGPLVRGRSGAPGAAVRAERWLRAAGCDVRAWLAWPSHARATSWAALDDPAGMTALIERRVAGGAGPAAGRLIGGAMHVAAGRHVLASTAPAITLIGVRGSGRPVSFLDRVLDDDAAGGLVVVSPRYRASAHVVALRIAPGDGAVRRVAKVARLDDDHTLAGEASVLLALDATLGTDGRCPRVIVRPGEAGSDDRSAPSAWPALVETGLSGPPLDPRTVRRDRDAAARAVAAFVAGMPVQPAAHRRRRIAARLGDALATIGAVADAADARELAALADRTRPVVARLATSPLPVVVEHGDPAHPNLVVLSDGRIGAVDWERGDLDGLPLHDLTIGLAYVAGAAVGAAAADATATAAAFGAAMRAPDPWAAVILDRASHELGLDPTHRPALVVAAFARSAAWLAAGLDVTAGVADPVAAAAWLERDRSVALWRAALDLAEAA
jgi:hypothetical protein